MAFTELEIKRHEKITSDFIEKRRPPVAVRDQVDLSYRMSNNSIEIFEIRPLWNKPDRKIEEPVA
ncbi:MAG: hypothetical protein MUC76_13795, partial [Spirochaetes bacterium]|nr:hypothetical protein [Spirochaetota bacterium]